MLLPLVWRQIVRCVCGFFGRRFDKWIFHSANFTHIFPDTQGLLVAILYSPLLWVRHPLSQCLYSLAIFTHEWILKSFSFFCPPVGCITPSRKYSAFKFGERPANWLLGIGFIDHLLRDITGMGCQFNVIPLSRLESKDGHNNGLA